MSKILVVDDEHAICWGLSQLARSMGHEVETASSAEQGLGLAATSAPDLLVLDVRLPGMDGLTAMEQFRSHLGAAPIIVITAFGELETAVQALRNGAFEYVLKPFDLAEIRSAIKRALRDEEISVAVVESDSAGEMLGCTPVMQEVFKRIALAADSDAAVQIQGESGVGKELAARAIHRHSARVDGPFVAVNIAALSPSLVESEIFGHVAGAFTGAGESRPGLLAQADGGTLFLDEVGDIPLPLQIKLLRALESGEFLPVGADQAVCSQFRVVSATHQDLQRQVRMGQFRHDLYFRLSAFGLVIPPLRDRVDDIPILANRFAAQCGKTSLTLAQETLDQLQSQPWHGNVRELRNAIEHASIVARTGLVLPEHLPPPQPRLGPETATCEEEPTSLLAASRARAEQLLDDPALHGEVYERFLEEVEMPLLQGALKRFDDECAPAARALGIHRTTLKRKIDQASTRRET